MWLEVRLRSWTGIPLTRLTETESSRLLQLEQRLHKRVIGQDEAVSAVSRAVRRARAGFKAKTDLSVLSCSSVLPV